MLVITRKIGESIIVGDNIEISITEIQRGKVKIAIDAPKSVSIFRKEIIEEVARTNIQANMQGIDINLDKLAEELIHKGER